MSRAYRYSVIGIIWIMAILCHYIAVLFFAPGTEIYALGAPGVGTFVDVGWRDQMYFVFVQAIPLLFMGGSLLWGFASEYEQQSISRGGLR